MYIISVIWLLLDIIVIVSVPSDIEIIKIIVENSLGLVTCGAVQSGQKGKKKSRL
jgi:hypothetical protein